MEGTRRKASKQEVMVNGKAGRTAYFAGDFLFHPANAADITTPSARFPAANVTVCCWRDRSLSNLFNSDEPTNDSNVAKRWNLLLN